MRPRAIRIFEILGWLCVAVGIFSIVRNWDAQLENSAAYGRGPAATAVLALCFTAFNAGLLWMVAHRANVPAKWIYVGLSALALIVTLPELLRLLPSGELLQREIFIYNLLRRALDAASLWFLFRPEAIAWFRRGGQPDPEEAEIFS
jgi:hypothetical protein